MKNMNSQRGATLIVVLIVLLLITIVCTIAVRRSTTSLKVATGEQAQQLMFQSSQAYLLKLMHFTAAQHKLNKRVDGLVGYVSQAEKVGHEVAFCYDDTMTSFFDSSRTGTNTNVVSGTTTNGLRQTQALVGGFCNPNNSNYTSARSAVMTQVYVKKTTVSPLGAKTEGTDHSSVSDGIPIRIHVISVIPALASDPSNITTCFSRFPAESDFGANTVVDCLRSFNIPYSAQVNDYLQSNDIS